jgi:hypothetical protein
VNRSAEAMTIFAVICAGIFPGIHVGRVWFAWFLFPIPNYNWIWPNFRSPLLWDVFAVSTYATVSALFWYMGMIPDLATLRDRADARLRGGVSKPFSIALPGGKAIVFEWLKPDVIRAYVYGMASLGWRFSSRHWHRYEAAYLILAGISTPLVLSVCTRSCRSTSRRPSCPVGTPRSSRPTSSRVRSSAASRWCCCS